MKHRLAAALALLTFAAACGDRRTRSSPADLVASPSRLDFGPTGIGSAKTQGLRLRNEGRSAVRISAITATIPNVQPVAFEPFSLTSSEEQIVQVTFAPTVEGAVTGALEIATDADNAAQTGVLVQEVAGLAVRSYVEVKERQLDFGKVPLDTVQMRTITVSNPTTVAANVTLTVTGDDAKDFMSSEASKTITVQPGETQSIPIAFHPSKLGLAQGSARVTVCDVCEPESVELTGSGIAQLVNVFPLSLDFGRISVGAKAEDKVTVVNDGTEPVVVEKVALDQPVYTLVNLPPMPLTLQPGQRAEVQVAFEAKTPGVAKRGILEIFVSTKAVAASGYKIPVQAEGGGACLQITPRALDFGVVPQEMSVTRDVQVYNRCYSDVRVGELAVRTSEGGFFSLGQASAGVEIASSSSASLKVTFTPRSSSHQSKGDLVFKVFEDRASHSEAVALTGSSRVFPPCTYSLSPSSLRFGAVPVGAEVVLGIGLKNDGMDQCMVGSFNLAAGSDAVFSTLPVSPTLLAPGAKVVLPVRVKPTGPGSFAGMVEAWVNHPTRGHIMANVTAEGVNSCLGLQPTQVDFGRTKLSCGTRARRITAVNSCSVPVTLSSVALSQQTSTELTLNAPSLPAVLPPAAYLDFGVSYAPTNDGLDTAALEVSIGNALPLVVGLSGEGITKPTQTDRFFQDARSQVDVLFVIDNSGSMMEEQQSLGQNFAAFLTAAQAAQVDYRIGVTTTGIESSPGGWSSCPGGVEGGEAGRLFPVNGSSPRIITPTTQNAAQVFAANVQVGWCHWNEQGLEGAYRALSTPLANSADDPSTAEASDGNLGFLRPNAKLVVLFVTDEDDFSPQPVAFYETFFRSLKGNEPSLLSLSAIVGPENLATCPTASSTGSRYLQLARATGGVTENICTPNWAESLKNISNNTFGPKRRFPLTQRPADPAQIVVVRDGQVVSSGYTYDATNNAVVFDESAPLSLGAEIDITYPLGC
ncbi:MAG: choice-of-anchor D domain-containing protein [Myxococcaceae bacterium]